MATVYKSKTGQWLIDVYGRGRIRLGRNRSDAAVVHRHVEILEKCLKFGLAPPADTLDWVRNIDARLRERLMALKLLADGSNRTVQDLSDSFSVRAAAVKNGDMFLVRVRSVVEFFGAETPLSDISQADAHRFYNWLRTTAGKFRKKEQKGLSPLTAACRMSTARQMFQFAVRCQWIARNPLDGITIGRPLDKSKSFYVTPEMAAKVLEQLPTVEDRTIFALARWAGMRVPSEAVLLRWTDVNWDRMSMTFRSPKTERFHDKAMRTCPIFPEILPHLQASWDAAGEGAVFVCPRMQTSKKQFRGAICAAITRAGLKPWPKLMVNLRASRATEVADQFGAKAESEWIGHGADVALLHYLMVTDDIWNRATGQTPRQKGPSAENAELQK